MTRRNRIFRSNDWLNSKLPFLLLFCLLLAERTTASRFVTPFILFVVFTFFYAILGYAANDIADQKIDQIAQKRNRLSRFSLSQKIIILLVVTILTIAPILIFAYSFMLLWVVVLNLFLAFFYSFKPLRFKERGIVGVIVSSFCQRCSPLLLVPFLVDVDRLRFCLLLAVAFCLGVRCILIHQLSDAEQDQKCNVSTFGRNHGLLAKILVFVTLIVEESLIICYLLSLMGSNTQWLPALVVVSFVIEKGLWVLLSRTDVRKLFLSFFLLPLTTYYCFTLPLAVLIMRMPGDYRFIFYFIVPFLLASVIIRNYFKIYLGYLTFHFRNRCFIIRSRKLKRQTVQFGNCYAVNVKILGDLSEIAQKKLVLAANSICVNADDLLPYLNEEGDIFISSSALSVDGYQQLRNKFQGYINGMGDPLAIYIVDYYGSNFKRRESALSTIPLLHQSCQRRNVTFPITLLGNKKTISRNSVKLWSKSAVQLYKTRPDLFLFSIPFFLISNLLLGALLAVTHFYDFIGKDVQVFIILALVLNAIQFGFVALFRTWVNRGQIRLQVCYFLQQRSLALFRKVPLTRTLQTDYQQTISLIKRKRTFVALNLIIMFIAFVATMIIQGFWSWMG